MAEGAGLQQVDLLGGKLHLFERLGSPFWWCGFHHKGRYIRRSTKQSSATAATKEAERWYHVKQAEITLGKPVGGPTVATVAKSALLTLSGQVKRGEKSSEYLKEVKRILETRILLHFGSIPIANVDAAEWEKFKKQILAQYPNLSRATLHQHKNALRVVLNEAYRENYIAQLPVFKDTHTSPRVKLPRIWFEKTEYTRLHRAIDRHAKKLKGTRWEDDAKELYDYTIFVANSGLRPGEARKVRFCDIDRRTEFGDDGQPHECLVIHNIVGKTGTAGKCKTMFGAVAPFERTVKRRGIKDPKKSQELLFKAYHRDMFNKVLSDANLKWSSDRPPRKRDLTVLRHTYIAFRLQEGAPVWDVAANCRTSVQMIEQHYVRGMGSVQSKTLNVVQRPQPSITKKKFAKPKRQPKSTPKGSFIAMRQWVKL